MATKKLHNLKYNTVQSTSEVKETSQSSVKHVLAEGKSSLAKGNSLFLYQLKKDLSSKKIVVDNFRKCVITHKIYECYINMKQK